MNERSSGMLLLFAFACIINAINGQIQFPGNTFNPFQSGSSANFPANLPPRLNTPTRRNDPDAIIVRGITKFTLDINRVLPSISQQFANADSIVYGPITIVGALAVVMLASIGQTFNEIANVLGLSNGLDINNNPLKVHERLGNLEGKLSGYDFANSINFATAIFVQNDYIIRQPFKQMTQDVYKSTIMNLDFEGNPGMAQQVINSWVSDRTNGKIPSLLNQAPPPNTRAIIASVLYFKALWEYPFFDGHTRLRPFYTNGRKSASNGMAEMMSNGGEFPYYKDQKLNAEIMGFPYKNSKTTMYVIMPNDSDKQKLKKLENMITADDIERLVSNTVETEAVILFPKMKLESTLDLKATLQNLGLRSLFNPNEANLALLSTGVQQRFSDVDAPFVSSIGGTQRQQPPVQYQPPRTSPPQRVPAPITLPPRATFPSRANTPRTNVELRTTTRSRTTQSPPNYQTQEDLRDRLIFTRFGDGHSSSANCIHVYDPFTNSTYCADIFQSRVRRRVSRQASSVANSGAGQAWESLRQQLIQNPFNSNPGLYADQVIHKVYIDITESGTEAAAATGVSLNRSGGRVTFRVDVPFLFFIYHEETKVILFWGSVKNPPLRRGNK